MEEEERIRNLPPPKPETPPPPPPNVHRMNVINMNMPACNAKNNCSPLVQKKIGNNQAIPFYIAKRTPPKETFQNEKLQEDNSPKAARQSMLRHATSKKPEGIFADMINASEISGIGSTIALDQQPSSRMLENMKDRLIQKIKDNNLTIPPLCSCHREWSSNAKCCNNCIYYRNTRLFVEHLASLLRSLDIPL